MRYLFYFYSCFNPVMFGELLDEAVKLSKEGNPVHFATCDGINKLCLFNKRGSKAVCGFCKRITKKVIIDQGLDFISLKDYLKENTQFCFSYNNCKEFRNLKYREVNIGLSIMSSYVSMTRNMTPKIDDISRPFFNQHLSQNVNFVDSIYNLVETIKPDILYTFNGRFEENRPIYDISRYLHITCRLTEVVNRNGKRYKVIFENSLPHSIKENKIRREYCWENYPLDVDKKIELGRSFFEKRRTGQDSGDKKIYVANQKEGSIPEIKKDKINIAIMNSSEDEFSAVGAEWDSLKLFPTQYDGIIFLLENSDKKIHYYLRIHPNLKGIPYKYHLLLNELDKKYSNITVIPANSIMSTYTLMEKMDKIVCFGSTMGVESVYWGIPSVLLGPSGYYYDDISYIPSTKEELLKLLTEKLEVRFNNNVFKIGAYILNKDPLVVDIDKQYRYVDFNTSKHLFLGGKYYSSPYLNFLINEHITGFLIASVRGLFDNPVFRRFSILNNS